MGAGVSRNTSCRTRNPIYLAFMVIGIGVGVILDNVWIAFAQPLFVLAINKIAIECEERYLESKFGEEYRAYKSRVRRWF